MIQRKILKELQDHLAKPEITMLTGPRQVGKTTLLKLLEKEIQSKGMPSLFFNLDVESHHRAFQSQEELLARTRLEFGNAKGVVFIDEIQRKENAGLFIKGLYDMMVPFKMVVSGSGSIEMKTGISDSLAGRKRLFELMPVSVDEFIDYRTSYKYTDSLWDYCRLEPERTKMLLKEYLNYGGYPRVITAETTREKQREMDEIYRSYIEKDIVYLLGVARPDAFGLMIRLLAADSGYPVNFTNLSKRSGLSIPTLKEYLHYAEKTFIIRTVKPFSGNMGKEITKAGQVYFLDQGFRNYSINRFGMPETQEEYPMPFQALIYWILHERLAWTGSRLHYWRTADGAEVDIIIDLAHKVIPVEVKYSTLNKQEIPRSLRSFIKAYQPGDAYIVNLAYEGQSRLEGTSMHWIPWYRMQSVRLE